MLKHGVSVAQRRESGFYHLQARYYDPNIGRLINADGQMVVNTYAKRFNITQKRQAVLLMDGKRTYLKTVPGVFGRCLLLLIAGINLTFSYFQRVQDAVEKTRGSFHYYIGFVSTQIYVSSGKRVIYNIGFAFFVILGITLLYHSILSKEEAEESTSSADTDKEGADPQDRSTTDSD